MGFVFGGAIACVNHSILGVTYPLAKSEGGFIYRRLLGLVGETLVFNCASATCIGSAGSGDISRGQTQSLKPVERFLLDTTWYLEQETFESFKLMEQTFERVTKSTKLFPQIDKKRTTTKACPLPNTAPFAQFILKLWDDIAQNLSPTARQIDLATGFSIKIGWN